MTRRLPYIPADYETTVVGGVLFHFSAHELTSHREFVQHISQTALQSTTESLNFTPRRQMHVCCYYNSEEAARALNRHVSPTMAMAPFSDEACGLVIIHSPCLDPRNRDASRMLRTFVHEFVHLFVAERSGSTKLLGDDNQNMRVSAWLNEGLAEVAGFQAIAAEDRLATISERFLNARNFYEFEALSLRLDDLEDALRAEAFVHATGAVNELCRQSSGVRAVFDQIPQIEAFFDSRDCFCPDRLAQYFA